LKLGPKEQELAALRRKLEDNAGKLGEKCGEVNVLHEKLRAANSSNKDLGKELENLRHQLKSSRANVKLLSQENDTVNVHLRRYTKRSIKRKLQWTEQENIRMTGYIQKHGSQIRLLQKLRNSWRHKFRCLQLQHAELKRRYHRAQHKIEVLLSTQHTPETIPEPQQDELRTIHLKDEKGHFIPDAIVCVMTLVGECEVAPERCGAVIQAVSRHVCRAHIPGTDLPSQRSALRFADRGQIIGKAHITETLLEADHWDLHTDGTSDSGKKYVSQQVTVDGQSLSTGYVPVATEDTTTLVDISMKLLEELSLLHGEKESHETFLQMLHQLSGLMSDRCNTMKSFDKSIFSRRKLMLQTDEDIQFLHCNAHFLLGLSAQCKNILARREKESGERFGRDLLAQFRLYQSKSESSASRYVIAAKYLAIFFFFCLTILFITNLFFFTALLTLCLCVFSDIFV